MTLIDALVTFIFQIIVSVHVPVEITKPHKIGLWYAVLEVCFGVLSGMKGQIIQRKTAIQGASIYFVSGCRYADT